MDGLWLVSYLALWAVVLLLVVLLLGLARELGAIHQRLGAPGALMSDAGLDIGSTAPDFTATEVATGRKVAFRAASGRDSLVLLLATDCGPCKELLPRLEAGWKEWQQRLGVFVVCEGKESEVRAFLEGADSRIPVLVDAESRIGEGFGHPPTPFAYLIDGAGVVKLKGVVNTRDDVERLIEGRARVLSGREVVADGRSPGAGATVPSVEPEVSYGQVD